MRLSEVKLSVIVHEGEDYNKIKEKVLDLLEGIDKEKVDIMENRGEGIVSSNLIYISVKIKKREHIHTFFRNLIKRGLDIDRFLNEMNSDEDYNVYVRLDKSYLLEKDKVFPLYGDNVFHLKISIDGYGKDREKVRDFFERYLKEVSNL